MMCAGIPSEPSAVCARRHRSTIRMHIDIDDRGHRVTGAIVYLNTETVVAKKPRRGTIDKGTVGIEIDERAARGIGGDRECERVTGRIGRRHLALQMRVQLGCKSGCPEYRWRVRGASTAAPTTSAAPRPTPYIVGISQWARKLHIFLTCVSRVTPSQWTASRPARMRPCDRSATRCRRAATEIFSFASRDWRSA